MRYAVVGCSACDHLWITPTDSGQETVACRRCGATYQRDSRHPLATQDTQAAARAARSALLAQRRGRGDLTTEASGYADHADRVAAMPAHRERYGWAADRPPLFSDWYGRAADDTPLFSDWYEAGADAYLARRFATPTCESESPMTATLPPEGDDPFPWAADPTGPEKTRLVVATALSGDSPTGWVPLAAALKRAYGASESRHYQRAAWIAERHPALYEKRTTAGGNKEVRATPEAVYLYRRMESVGTPDGDGLSSETPVERVRRMCGEVRGVKGDAFRAVMLREFARHKRLTADTYRVLGNRDTGEVLAVEIGDRYSDVSEASSVRARGERYCDALTDAFDVAVVVTFTVPRGCIESVAESASQLRAWKNAFHDRLSYSPTTDGYAPRPGRVPPNVVFCHPHGDGVAHLHVVYGGVRRLMDWRAVRAMWAEIVGAAGPVQVDLRSVSLRGDRWPVRRGEAVPDAYGDMREYVLSATRDLARLARTDADDLDARADALADGEGTDADRDLAALALFMASRAAAVSASPSLRDRTRNTATASSWTFLGVFGYGTMPTYLRERAVFVTRPRSRDRPPPRP